MIIPVHLETKCECSSMLKIPDSIIRCYINAYVRTLITDMVLLLVHALLYISCKMWQL